MAAIEEEGEESNKARQLLMSAGDESLWTENVTKGRSRNCVCVQSQVSKFHSSFGLCCTFCFQTNVWSPRMAARNFVWLHGLELLVLVRELWAPSSARRSNILTDDFRSFPLAFRPMLAA
jgi:hypothetical protein